MFVYRINVGKRRWRHLTGIDVLKAYPGCNCSWNRMLAGIVQQSPQGNPPYYKMDCAQRRTIAKGYSGKRLLPWKAPIAPAVVLS